MESQLALNNVLVIGEIEKKSLTKATLEAISAAKSIAKNQVELLLFSSKSYEKDSLIIKGLDVVFLTPFDLSEEQKVELIAKTAIERESNCLISPKDFSGGLMNQAAHRLGSALAHDCSSLAVSDDGYIIATRSVYGGSAVAEVKCLSQPSVVSLRIGSYVQFNQEIGPISEYIDLETNASDKIDKITVLERHAHPSDGIKIEDARVVVSGGRGLGGPEPFAQLENLASLFNGAVGASRAACDAGWVPHSFQVGLTGKAVSPDLYFAIGISGASQHLAGITGARDIVSINKDPNAAIFKESRFGIVGDWSKALPAFIEQLHELLDNAKEDK